MRMPGTTKLSKLAEALGNLPMTVLPSSICSGFGVYAMTKIAKNTIIGEYPGSLITDEADVVLRDLLRLWRQTNDAETERRIKILKDNFGISMEPLLPQRFRKQSFISIPNLQGTKPQVNWNRVLVTIYGYSFQTEQGTLVPSRISYTGSPLFDMDAHEKTLDCSSLTPFIDEAPPGSFKNLLTSRVQKPFYNVDVVVKAKQVIFFAKRSIPAGNELLFFYGPTYNRNYKIHMHPKNCGWGPQDFYDEDEEEKEASRSFYVEQSHFEEEKEVLNFVESSRRHEMKMNLKRLLSASAAVHQSKKVK